MSASRHLKVTTKGAFGQATIELDGEEIQNGLRRVALELEAGEVNQATLELLAPVIEVVGEFRIHLPEETRAALKRLGWTPPEETS
jgi:hypothetical protein